MSRGQGQLQTGILEYLTGLAGGSISFERLRWELWDGKTQSPTANLPNTRNTSTKRAVKGLVKAGKVLKDERRLISFDEAVQNFPSKTLFGTTRSLRLSLLPVLSKAIADGEKWARYSPADNEKFHIESLKPEELQALKAKWLRLEPRLIEILPALSSTNRNTLFILISKAKSIFEIKKDLTCSQSFSEYLRTCTQRAILPEPLVGEVQAFSDALVPLTHAGHLRLKGFIHAFAHIPNRGRCQLKEDTIEYLAKACPEVVRQLPGFKASSACKPSDGRYFSAFLERKDTHSPQLYRFFDQSIFQTFIFLTLP